MRVNTSVLLMRRHLGEALAGIRIDRGLTQQQVAADLSGRLPKFTEDRLSYIERGKGWPNSAELSGMLEAYGVSVEQRVELEVLLREGKQAGNNWWDANQVKRIASSDLLHFLACEDTASEILMYTGGYVPGPMQTEEYIRTLFAFGRSRHSAADREGHVQLRLERRKIVRRTNPPAMRVLCSEAAIRAQVGGASVMHRQLVELAEIAELEHVSLRVIPFTASVMPVAMVPFQVFQFQSGDGPGAASTERNNGDDMVEDPEAIAVLRENFDVLESIALSCVGTLELINSVAKEMVQ